MQCCVEMATSTNQRENPNSHIRNEYFHVADRQIYIDFWLDVLSIPIERIDLLFCCYAVLKGISILKARFLN